MQTELVLIQLILNINFGTYLVMSFPCIPLCLRALPPALCCHSFSLFQHFINHSLPCLLALALRNLLKMPPCTCASKPVWTLFSLASFVMEAPGSLSSLKKSPDIQCTEAFDSESAIPLLQLHLSPVPPLSSPFSY